MRERLLDIGAGWLQPAWAVPAEADLLRANT